MYYVFPKTKLLIKRGCLKWDKHIIFAVILSDKGAKLRADSLLYCSKVCLQFKFTLVWVCWSLDSDPMKRTIAAFQMLVCMTKSTVTSWRMEGRVHRTASGLKVVQAHHISSPDLIPWQESLL